MAVKDLSYTDDLVVSNGDFLVINSDEQHIEHILLADIGHFRQWPLIGVGLEKWQNASINTQELKQKISLQLRSDNFEVKTLNITDDYSINIDARRKT